MRVAVIGGTGLLGQAIAAQWHGDELILAGSRDVDIRDHKQVDEFIVRHRPEWVVLAAAFPDVDGCERDPERADQVNHQGPVHVAEACKKNSSRLMLISTDYAFDGSKTAPYEPEDPVNPLSVYARSKVEGENAVLHILPGGCVARVSWLFGPEKKCFANTVMEWAEKGQAVRALVDQTGVPNFTYDLVPALEALVHAGPTGIVHVTNPGVASWYEFACELVRVSGLRVPVERAKMEDLKRPARRPHYSALSDASLRRYGIKLRHWREALPDYLQRRRKLMPRLVPQAAG